MDCEFSAADVELSKLDLAKQAVLHIVESVERSKQKGGEQQRALLLPQDTVAIVRVAELCSS